jgi:DNA modification methylase
METTVRKEQVAINAAGEQAAAPGASSGAAAVAAALSPCAAVIEHRSAGELKPNPRNARTHSKKQVQLLGAGITEFGFLVPVLVDENDVILAGHGRVEAAKQLGMSKVPTIRVAHLTPERKRAFVLADNRLAQLAGWDDALLGAELDELFGLELDFDIEVTGFDTVDVDRLDGMATEQAVEQEVVAEVDRKEPAISALGDLWQLGLQRLFCGSALEEESYRRLLGDERVQMVFTDPPYNVPVDGHVCGLGSIKHAEFKMASGEMSDEQFVEFLATFMRLSSAFSIDGAIHYLCMDWRHMGQMLAAARPTYGAAKNLCVWSKTNAGMGTFYRSQHELVFVFKVGTAKHINNFGLGERGRYRSNVWVYPGVNSFRRGRMEELEAHPTVKPLAMVIDAVKDCSRRGGIVLDPFVGSGTTLLAAEKAGRMGRAIELDPHYLDVTIRRWQALTGQSAVHLGNGLTFDQLAAQGGRELE